MAKQKDEKERKASLIEEAQERFSNAMEVEGELRKQMEEDYKFLNVPGAQWDPEAKKQREQDGRPWFEVNRLKPSVLNITNEQRQQRPQIKVNPIDNQGDPETAKIFQGIIKHIEVDSGADTAYDTAGEHAATMGRGYFRVITQYVNSETFDQEIKIKRVRDPFAVVIDPNTYEVDGSDATWGAIVTDYDKETFEREFPDAEGVENANDWNLLADGSGGWMTKDSIRVCEYFYKVETPDHLLLLKNGKTVLNSEYTGSQTAIVKKRAVSTCQWKWAKLTCNEVLEETNWPGIYLPIIPVVGEEYFDDGMRMYRGIVQAAKGSQILYNFSVSNELEMIGLMPKAPFIAAEGQIEGYEEQWENATKRPQAVLQYKPTSVNGTLIGAPQRNQFEAPIQALSANRQQAAEDIKTTTGVYDASLGARSNETSGKAIIARQAQGATTTYHFTDNLNRAIRHLGKILVDLIPKVYDTKRVIAIVGDNGEQETVAINKLFEKDGKEYFYDLSAGKYDVVISTGPSFASRRQESVQAMMEAAQAYPPLMQIAADVLFRNMDFPGADEIARRVAKTIDPKFLETPEDGVKPEVKLQQAAMAVQQMQMQLEQLNAHSIQLEQALAEATQTQQGEQAKLALQAQKQQLDNEIAQQKLAVEQAKVEAQIQKQQFDAQMQMAELQLERQKLALQMRQTMSEEGLLLEGVDEVTHILASKMQDKFDMMKREIVETMLDAPMTVEIEKTADDKAVATIVTEHERDDGDEMMKVENE